MVFAGPGLGALLADQGADVIKVEPLEGDPIRGPVKGQPDSTAFIGLNRNKRGMVLNLRTPEGKEIAKRLFGQVDIVTENFRPGVLERQGLGYDQIRDQFPRLIWVSVTGYGLEGPYVERRGYDMLAQAIGGSLAYRYWPDGTPMYSGIPLGDNATGMLAIYGVALALYLRERTGKGQRVSADLLSSVLALQRTSAVRSDDASAPPAYSMRKVPWQAPYRCSDGKYVMVALNVAPEFVQLCEALDLGAIAQEPRFKFPAYDAADDLMDLFAGVFETRTAEEWQTELLERDVPIAIINTLHEGMNDPHVRATDMVLPVDHPSRGRFWVASTPIKLLDNPPRSHYFPWPAPGQHTADVMHELGYNDDEIRALAAKNIIAMPEPD